MGFQQGLNHFFTKNRKYQIINFHGQALVEYVLVLIVTVSIILSLIAQIFTPFGNFLDKYMGSYVSCLLDFGELPTLGSPISTIANEDGCDARFETFSVSSGRPPKAPPPSSRVGQDSNGNSQPRSSSTQDGLGNEGNVRNRGGAGSSSTSPSTNTLLNSPNGPNSADHSFRNEKIVDIELPNSERWKSRQNTFNNEGRTYDKARTLDGRMEKEILERERSSIKSGPKIVSASQYEQKSKVIPLRKPAEKGDAKENEEKPFTIGDFLRVFLIAGVIIALVVFVGGQLLQISKSSEK